MKLGRYRESSKPVAIRDRSTLFCFAKLVSAEIPVKEKSATVKSHSLNNAFQHGVTAWRLVTRSALSNFVIVRNELYHNGGRHDKRED